MLRRLFGKSDPKTQQHTKRKPEYDPEYPIRNITDPQIREDMAVLDTLLKNFLYVPEGKAVVDKAQSKFTEEAMLKMSIEDRVKTKSDWLAMLTGIRMFGKDPKDKMEEFKTKYKI